MTRRHYGSRDCRPLRELLFENFPLFAIKLFVKILIIIFKFMYSRFEFHSLRSNMSHITLNVPYPYAPLSVRCTLIRTIFGRDENAYKPKRLCRRVPLSVRCTLIRHIFCVQFCSQKNQANDQAKPKKQSQSKDQAKPKTKPS
jgi:hypothetical protein